MPVAVACKRMGLERRRLQCSNQTVRPLAAEEPAKPRRSGAWIENDVRDKTIIITINNATLVGYGFCKSKFLSSPDSVGQKPVGRTYQP